VQVYGHTQFDYSGGQRGGPVTTYLQQFLAHGDRTVLAQFSNVTRVMRNGSIASGVQLTQCNPGASCQQYNVSVTANMGQIILSAGALGTPKLLYFSGIGPSDILTRLNDSAQLLVTPSNWIVNENVGRGLYDNPNTFIMLQSPEVQSYAFGYDGTGIGVVPSDLAAYRDHRTGPYTSPGQTGVFWDTVTRPDGRKVGVCSSCQVSLMS
jgi:cellobiose dehydrogenase (acceptor)